MKTFLEEWDFIHSGADADEIRRLGYPPNYWGTNDTAKRRERWLTLLQSASDEDFVAMVREYHLKKPAAFYQNADVCEAIQRETNFRMLLKDMTVQLPEGHISDGYNQSFTLTWQ